MSDMYLLSNGCILAIIHRSVTRFTDWKTRDVSVEYFIFLSVSSPIGSPTRFLISRISVTAGELFPLEMVGFGIDTGVKPLYPSVSNGSRRGGEDEISRPPRRF
jgi:hypothetical protein